MHYTLYGINSNDTSDNKILKTCNSRNIALTVLKGYARNKDCGFTGFFILERVRKNDFPYSYDFFDKTGVCYKSGIMASSFKPSFWLSNKD